MNDDYNLARFVKAQASVYETVIQDLRSGKMCPDHMDFIFPRLAAGHDDPASEPYAISSLDEASAYLAYPLLGGRYRECISALQGLPDLSARAAFGDEGARQLHASLTLFSEASDEFLFETMFYAWFDGLLDKGTENALKGSDLPATG